MNRCSMFKEGISFPICSNTIESPIRHCLLPCSHAILEFLGLYSMYVLLLDAPLLSACTFQIHRYFFLSTVIYWAHTIGKVSSPHSHWQIIQTQLFSQVDSLHGITISLSFRAMACMPIPSHNLLWDSHHPEGRNENHWCLALRIIRSNLTPATESRTHSPHTSRLCTGFHHTRFREKKFSSSAWLSPWSFSQKFKEAGWAPVYTFWWLQALGARGLEPSEGPLDHLQAHPQNKKYVLSKGNFWYR